MSLAEDVDFCISHNDSDMLSDFVTLLSQRLQNIEAQLSDINMSTPLPRQE